MRDYILVYVNGLRHEVRGPAVFTMAAEWLRKNLELVGTKIVCAEGDCGACTILKASPSQKSGVVPDFISMNSCIATVAHLDCCSIATVEGMSKNGIDSPVQSAMQQCHASQCGYCTPGFVMAMSALFEGRDRSDARTAANYLTGNLCRCTGYSPILEAATKVEQLAEFRAKERYLSPVILEDLRVHRGDPVRIELADGRLFHSPTKIDAASKFTSQNTGAKVLGAATDVGVQTNKGKALPKCIVSLRQIAGLDQVKISKDRMIVGANCTLAVLRRACEKKVPEFAEFLNIFASPQIKNVATLVGNVANGSPIGDTLPFLLVSDARVHLRSWRDQKSVERELAFTEFFKGYKQFAIEPDEIISHMSFAIPNKSQELVLLKVSQRKDLDISAISAAFLLERDSANKTVKTIRIAYGGVAAMPIRLHTLEKFILGCAWDQLNVGDCVKILQQSVHPLSDVRGTEDYRRLLATNLFLHFIERINEGVRKKIKPPAFRIGHETLPLGSTHA